MVTVLIPHPLRKFTDGVDEVTAKGTTVGEIIEHLEEDHPGLKGILRAEDGGIKAFVNIYLNKEDIRFLKSLDLRIDWSHEFKRNEDFQKKLAELHAADRLWIDYATTYYWYQETVGYEHDPLVPLDERVKPILHPNPV